MSKTLTLARREMAAYFFSPMAYVIGALFLLASGVWFFWKIFIPGSEATLRPLFDAIAALMVFAIPLLTMRLVADEFRSGTIETLMTAPVTDGQVIAGKFLGVMVFYIALLATTLVYLALIVAYGAPDLGVALMGYLGLILLGAAFISVGIFTSTLTRYQLVAALVGIAVLAGFTFLTDQLAVRVGDLALAVPWTGWRFTLSLDRIIASVNALSYFEDFSKGILDARGVVFFVSATVLFLFVSTKTLESRRWR